MEGDKYFQFKVRKTPGKCPVRYCHKHSRSGSGDKPEHRLCSRHRQELNRRMDISLYRYHDLKNSARKRGIPFNLTLDEYRGIVSQQLYITHAGVEKHQLHIDRIDATKGYEVGNIQILTCSENVAKGNRERYAQEKIHGVAEENMPF